MCRMAGPCKGNAREAGPPSHSRVREEGRAGLSLTRCLVFKRRGTKAMEGHVLEADFLEGSGGQN